MTSISAFLVVVPSPMTAIPKVVRPKPSNPRPLRGDRSEQVVYHQTIYLRANRANGFLRAMGTPYRREGRK